MKTVLAILFLVLSQVASAGNIDIEVGAGNIPGILDKEAQYHLDAILMAIADNKEVVTNSRQMYHLRSRMAGMTVARFEYTYEVDGREYTRVYHARSGRSIGGTILDAKYERNATSSESDGSGTLEDDIARDLGEDRFYPADTPFDVRVTNLRPVKGSAIASKGVKADAEFKAIRSIQTDIVENRVPKGGKLAAYVTKEPCATCRDAIRNFAAEYDIDGTVYHLIEARGNVPVEGKGLIPRSMRAHQHYFTTNANRVNRMLKTGHVTRPTALRWGEDTARLLLSHRELELSGPGNRCE